MGIGNLFKSLFGGGASAVPAEVTSEAKIEYKSFTIEAAPIKEGNQYRTAGFISGERDGENRRVQFIRADNSSDRQSAIDHSLGKGRQIVDEQGAALLDRTQL